MTRFEHGYALLIGVDANAVAKWALPDVAKDIAALREVLVHPERCAYPAEHVKTLTGKEATRQGILDGLEWLSERVQQDAVATAVIYYTGHGWRDTSKTPADFYLIPYDVKDHGAQTRALRATDFAAEIAGMQPQRLLVILDCCHAAGMGVKDVARLPSGYISAALAPEVLMQDEPGGVTPGAKGLETLAQGRGRAVLSASTGKQSSYIRKDRKMSIFTYHLIEALTGHAQPQAGAQDVLVSDVMSHVYRQVPVSTRADWGKDQTPDYQVSGNFPVAQLLGGKGLAKGQLAPAPESLHATAPSPVAALSGKFAGPVAAGGGEAVDMRGSQGALYKPSGPVYQIIQQRYPLLKDYVYDIDTDIKRVTQWFVGRAFVFDWLEAQLRTLPCGYLRLVADAGLGKTTIAAEIARRYGALVHFVNASEGVTHPDQCLKSLCAQLIARYGLPHDHLPERAGQDANFLQTLLQEAAAKRGDAPVLLVIDALDEADPVAAGCNWLLLPNHLPEGVYVLLTHRPGDYTIAVAAQTRQPEPLVIAWDDPRQQGDIAAHLRRQAERPEISRALEEAAPPIVVEQFVDALQAAAEGNFMYLDYVLDDITTKKPGFDPLDLQGLPHGLRGYYEHFWQQMQPGTEAPEAEWEAWEIHHLPILEGLGVAGEPVPARWLVEQTGLSERTVQRILVSWQRFLRCERREGDVTWRIVHRSFADFLAEKGEVNLPKAHRRVAAWYLDAWGGWEAGRPRLSTASGQHGGYGLRHLALHLSSAAWWAPLCALFKTDAWLQVRVPADGYLYDGYLTDLDYAWRDAEAEARQQIAAEAPPDALAECVRYALIRTTVNSLAGNYVPELVTRAVEVDLWSAAHALSVAAKMPDAEQRAKIYKLLLGLEALTPVQRQAAQAGGLAAARAIGDKLDRVQALAALASQLTGEAHAHVLTEGLVVTWAIKNEDYRGWVLAALAPHLTGDLLAEGLAMAREIENEQTQAEALAALAPQLTGDLLVAGLAAARAIENEWRRARVLAALALQLTGDARQTALAKELAAARAIKDEEHRAQALAALAPQLEGKAREKALAECLAAAQAIGYEYGKAKALAALAPQLTGDARQTALAEGLTAARAIENEWRRARVLAALASQLTGKARESALIEELAAAQEIESEWPRAKVLAVLAPLLTGNLVAEGLVATQAIKDEMYRAKVLAVLAPLLTGNLVAEGLVATQAIKDEMYRAKVLTSLAPQLTGDLLAEGLTAAWAIENEGYRAQVLAALAPLLTGNLLTKELTATRVIWDEEYWAKVLAALAPQLTGDTRERVLVEGLAAARAIKDEEYRAEALTSLIPQLTGRARKSALAEGLAAARAIGGERAQVKALTALAPLLTGEARESMLVEGLTAARAIKDEEYRAEALAALAPQLTGEARESMLVEGLTAARAIKDEEYRAEALAALAPQLTGEAREAALAEGLAAARAIKDEYKRTKALAAFIPQLTGEARERALEEGLATARAIEDEYKRTEALVALAPQLTGEARESVLAEGLAAARAIENEWDLAQVLTALAPQLTEDARERVLEEGLAAARAIKDEMYRAGALAALAPHLTGDLLAEGLATARAIEWEWGRAWALVALLPRFSGAEAQAVRHEYQAVILAALRASEHQKRDRVLWLLADKDVFNLDALALTPGAFARIAAAVVDICRRWEWV